MSSLVSAKSKVTRTFSDKNPIGGSIIVVTLTVDVEEDTYYAIDEIIPMGWKVTNTTGTHVEGGQNIRWAVLTGVNDTTYSYTIQVPKDASGYYSFDGAYMFESDKENQEIGGETGIIVESNNKIEIKDDDKSTTPTKKAKADCVESWSCSDWSGCLESGIKIRECIDENNCGETDDKPEEMKSCVYLPHTSLESQNTGYEEEVIINMFPALTAGEIISEKSSEEIPSTKWSIVKDSKIIITSVSLLILIALFSSMFILNKRRKIK